MYLSKLTLSMPIICCLLATGTRSEGSSGSTVACRKNSATAVQVARSWGDNTCNRCEGNGHWRTA